MIDLNEHALKFTSLITDIIKSTFAVDAEYSTEVQLQETLSCNKELYSTLMVTGSFYGEYILAFDVNTALDIMGLKKMDDGDAVSDHELEEIRSTFSELVNIVTGTIYSDLKTDSETEINLTAPRFYKGELFYPAITVAKTSIIVSESHEINCFFYLDMMGLDINSSYKKALTTLDVHYKELLETQNNLVQHQTRLIQSEKIAAIGALSAGIAHNLNTPLGTISLGTSQIEKLIVDKEDDAAVLRTIKVIKNTTLKMAEIIKILRKFSNNIEMEKFEKLDVGSLVDETIQDFNTTFSPEDLEISVRTPAKEKATIQLECSKLEIKKLILCMMQNSFEVLKNEPPQINTEDRWISIDLSDTGENVILEISNNGQKIEAELIERIFDPFYTSKDPSHAGLGLTLAKGIVDGHGGAIFLNIEHKNTSFVIVIPKKQNKERSTPKNKDVS